MSTTFLMTIVLSDVCFSSLKVPPGPPIVRIVDTTDHSIDVEWDPPLDNGGGEIQGYHVDKVMAGTKDWSRNTERPWKQRTFTVFGVREGAKYVVRVIAINSAGEGTPGMTSAVIVRNPAGNLSLSGNQFSIW